MIKIVKPPAAPAKLEEGKAHILALERERIRDPSAGASLKKAFTFDNKIYGAPEVKQALIEAQHEKCCYCEGSFLGQAYGDVEHFRPKARIQQRKNGTLLYPGYYWLAYEWSNLYFACERCNRGGKRNLFPVADPANRPTSRGDHRIEQAQLLDPGGTIDPREHIKFNGAAPLGVTALGRNTIAVLELDRVLLTAERLKHLKYVDALQIVAHLPIEELDEELLQRRRRANIALTELCKPSSEYSAMTQDNLNNNFSL